MTTKPSDEYVRRLLDETREELSRADTKASIVLAGAGVAVGALLAGLITGDLKLSGQPDNVVGLAWFAGLLLLSGISLLAAAVYPRTGKPEQGHARYFREVLQHKGDEERLRKAVEKESSDIGARDLQQVRVLSASAMRKYTLTGRGMWLLGLGFFAASGAGLLTQR